MIRQDSTFSIGSSVLIKQDEFCYYEDMTESELRQVLENVIYSNVFLRLENDIFERYLMRRNPESVQKIAQILETAKRVQKIAPQHSRTSPVTSASGSLVNVRDKDVASVVSFYQLQLHFLLNRRLTYMHRIEMVNTEIRELQKKFKTIEQTSTKKKIYLRARIEENQISIREILKSREEFEENVVQKGVDIITGKIPAEKFIRYIKDLNLLCRFIEDSLKVIDLITEQIRLKMATIKCQIKKVKLLLRNRKELGETLRVIDFEQLNIENKICLQKIDEKNQYLLEMKRNAVEFIIGRYNITLSKHKKKVDGLVLIINQWLFNSVVERLTDCCAKVYKFKEHCIFVENEKHLKIYTKRFVMSITDATINLLQRIMTIGIRNVIAFFVIVLYGETYGKYLEGLNVNLGDALVFLREYDSAASLMCTRVMIAQWNFATNVTDANHQKMVDEQILKLKFERASWRKAVTFAWSRIPDPLARRELKMIATKGRSSLTDDKFNEIHRLIAEMKEIYVKARVCSYKQIDGECNLSLDYDLNKIMVTSKDYDELLHYWHAWHEVIGPQLQNKYLRYVQLANRAAKLNGFADAGDQMRELFEDEYFQQNMAEIMSAVTPLYKNLFTYVRSKLIERYGDRIREDGPLPAHVLGDMWSQNWEGLFELVQPFPASRKLDVTLDMMIQGITPIRMFQIAEEFFTSLGMKPMPPEFWKFSILEKPIDREIKCTPSAWDFCNRIDYRIKQCTRVTMEDLLSTHYEMAHLQYYLQYKDHPLLFRNEAIPGFHEAVSDAIGLSIFTRQHLYKIGLHNNLTDNYDSSINFLMLMALRKVAYMPFAYIVDRWRWRVFSDGVEDMTAHWWELRLQYQGIVPPVPRFERNFDPAAKYHIPADSPYAKYFVSTVLQFQLFQSLCEISGHTGELHTCDLYRSREAGRLLSDILSMGASRPWQDVVRHMTRSRTNRIDAGAMLKYFEPLNAWLKRQNEMQPVIGWITSRDDRMYLVKIGIFHFISELFAQWYENSARRIELWSLFPLLLVTAKIIIYINNYILHPVI
ncbi:ACE enzyme, partial [Acromyrmex charruanus]